MTIREAVELVIQAGALARGGELFVLDMGAPVRIRDLAEKMVRLSGRSIRDPKNPDGDIAIEVTGLRPGEKMQEELVIDGTAVETLHPRILEVKESAADLSQLESELARFEANEFGEAIEMRIHALLRKWVAGYTRGSGQGEVSNLRSISGGGPH
jgi:FlaA1/EpsC-like NDP-sugar epimerase